MPNPLAQAGRALEALVIVLVGIVGIVTLLKRAGLAGGTPTPPVGGTKGGGISWWKSPVPGKPPAAATASGDPSFSLTVVQSQTLPGAGGATLHLLSVADKALLLVAATAQSVTLLSEWEQAALQPTGEEARADQAAFADYLTRAGVAPGPSPVRAAGDRIALTADRLQDLLARSHPPSPEDTTP